MYLCSVLSMRQWWVDSLRSGFVQVGLAYAAVSSVAQPLSLASSQGFSAQGGVDVDGSLICQPPAVSSFCFRRWGHWSAQA